MMEEGSHRRQPRIARLDLVLPRSLQVIEEGKDGVAIQSLDGEIAWRTSGPSAANRISMRRASR